MEEQGWEDKTQEQAFGTIIFHIKFEEAENSVTGFPGHYEGILIKVRGQNIFYLNSLTFTCLDVRYKDLPLYSAYGSTNFRDGPVGG